MLYVIFLNEIDLYTKNPWHCRYTSSKRWCFIIVRMFNFRILIDMIYPVRAKYKLYANHLVYILLSISFLRWLCREYYILRNTNPIQSCGPENVGRWYEPDQWKLTRWQHGPSSSRKLYRVSHRFFLSYIKIPIIVITSLSLSDNRLTHDFRHRVQIRTEIFRHTGYKIILSLFMSNSLEYQRKVMTNKWTTEIVEMLITYISFYTYTDLFNHGFTHM